MSFPPKFDYNKNEITITEVERRSILLGFLKASEHHLLDLQSIQNPSYAVQHITKKLETDLQEIRKEYETYKHE